MRRATFAPTFDGWRGAARAALADGVPPHDVAWTADDAEQTSLLALHAPTAPSPVPNGGAPGRVPRAFVKLARAIVCHRDGGRWNALYRVLWRLTHGEPSLLEVATDPDVHRLLMMERAIRRDIHKMHAFVRFRAVEHDGATDYVAWFEPAHLIVERATPFFARRFASMRWTILTPDRCAHWDGDALRFAPGASRAEAASGDAMEEMWRTYYAHIFNPARLALDTMRAEMPKRYWHNLPEAELVAGLTRDAPRRVAAMLAQSLGPAETLPADLATDPDAETRRARAAVRLAREEGTHSLAHADPAYLALPNAWDPAHDPGTVEARRRDDAVRDDAPAGLLLDGVRVLHGVAGWTDPTLLAPGVFYPDDARTPEARLRYYASRYPMVEVDATYYSPPSRAMAAAWAARTPAGFTFDVKAFALMTGHAADVRRLPDWLRRALPARLTTGARVDARGLPTDLLDELWRRFLAALDPLRDANKLGAVFLQFPRTFEPNAAAAAYLRLARERLGDVPGAVEFRNPDWVAGRVASRTLGLLRELDLAYTIVDAPPGTRSSMPPLVAVTSPSLVVVRLHGRRVATWEVPNDPVSERYRYLYDQEQLAAWVPRIRSAIDVARSTGAFPRVHLSFNNNHGNYGAVNAREMAAMLLADGGTALGTGAR